MHVAVFRGNQWVFQGNAKCLVLPSESGEISVCDFHAPMLCALTSGDVQIDERPYPVLGGLARVAENSATLIVY